MAPPVRLVLANDDPIIVEGLRAMLAPFAARVEVVGCALGDPDIEVVGHDPSPDVLLIDAFARRAGGLDAAAKVLAQDPQFAVAVFTTADDPRLTLQALRLGVRGYVLKSASPPDLVGMLERLRDGEIVVDPGLATDAALLAARTLDLGDWAGAHLGLTRREAELLTLLGQGSTLREAAGAMGLSLETVRTHTRNIYRKLDVSDRAGAVAVAWREGIVR